MPKHLAPRTSVIMPVYNTADSVVGAIESVLAQTDPDFELLVLIDGSPDNASQQISDFLAKNPDSRIRVFDNQENKGVSAVRNQGLDEAQGNWIAFLDSDDRYKPNFLETLHSYAFEHGAEIAMGTHTLVEQDGKTTVRRRFTPGLYTGKQAAQLLLEDSFTPYIWDKIFSARLFKNLRFPTDIHRAEDAVIVLSAVVRASFVVAVNRSVYEYSVGAGGLTWGRITPVDESIRLMEYLRKATVQITQPEIERACEVQSVLTYLNNAQQALVASNDESEHIIERCRDQIKWKQILITLPRKPIFSIAGTLLKISPLAYRTLYSAYVKRSYGL